MKRCPECRTETVEERHETVTADVCPQGHGLWLLESELLEAVRTVAGDNPVGNAYEEGRSLSLAADHDVELGDAVRVCPMCDRPMGSVDYRFHSGVIVDVCATHGVWLDAGELETLEADAEGRSDSTTPEGAARAAHLTEIGSDEPDVIYLRPSITDMLAALMRRRGPRR